MRMRTRSTYLTQPAPYLLCPLYLQLYLPAAAAAAAAAASLGSWVSGC